MNSATLVCSLLHIWRTKCNSYPLSLSHVSPPMWILWPLRFRIVHISSSQSLWTGQCRDHGIALHALLTTGLTHQNVRLACHGFCLLWIQPPQCRHLNDSKSQGHASSHFQIGLQSGPHCETIRSRGHSPCSSCTWRSGTSSHQRTHQGCIASHSSSLPWISFRRVESPGQNRGVFHRRNFRYTRPWFLKSWMFHVPKLSHSWTLLHMYRHSGIFVCPVHVSSLIWTCPHTCRRLRIRVFPVSFRPRPSNLGITFDQSVQHGKLAAPDPTLSHCRIALCRNCLVCPSERMCKFPLQTLVFGWCACRLMARRFAHNSI